MNRFIVLLLISGGFVCTLHHSRSNKPKPKIAPSPRVKKSLSPWHKANKIFWWGHVAFITQIKLYDNKAYLQVILTSLFNKPRFCSSKINRFLPSIWTTIKKIIRVNINHFIYYFLWTYFLSFNSHFQKWQFYHNSLDRFPFIHLWCIIFYKKSEI